MKKVGKTGVFLFAVIAALLCFVNKANAATDRPIINEIHPNPSGIGEDTYEWVEIYVPTGSPVDIASLSLKKSSSATVKNLSNAICQTTDNIYYVCNLGSSWLVNGGATISLLNSSSENDKVTYESFEGQKGKSFSRVPDGVDTNDDEHDFLILSPSRGAENILPPQIIYSDQIAINELLPQPLDGSTNEFIELFNSGTTEVDLSGWQIDDIANDGSSSYTIPPQTTIPACSYFVLYNSIDHISWNDSGDSARLIDPNGTEKSTLTYSQSKRGQSYSLVNNLWGWSTTLTPNLANIMTSELVILEEEPIAAFIPIREAKDNVEGHVVSVNGSVTVLPGILSSQYIYIQDNTGGIQVYLHSGDFPNLQLGQKIEVLGELTTAYGEKRIKILLGSDIKIFTDIQVMTPAKKDIIGIIEDDVGTFIQTEGAVSETSGDTFVIKDSSQLSVIIKEGTGIVKPKTKKGTSVRITGILTCRLGSYRILPISQDGVTILASGILPVTGADLVGVLDGINFKKSLGNWTNYFGASRADARRGFGLLAR